jgi:putative RecB family exonuclease
VHRVLEQLFDVPPERRDLRAATDLVAPSWAEALAEYPQLAEMFGTSQALAQWLESAAVLLRRYFTMEDPRRLRPAERELYVETDLASGLRLRGYVDRLEVSTSGLVRVVDYKTGTAPPEAYEGRALFQMKFYALVLWRTSGVVPALLQLMYLGDGEVLRYEPTEADLLGTERKVEAIWAAIRRATDTGDWRPSPGRRCDWCAHHDLCPAWGGTPPPLPGPET